MSHIGVRKIRSVNFLSVTHALKASCNNVAPSAAEIEEARRSDGLDLSEKHLGNEAPRYVTKKGRRVFGVRAIVVPESFRLLGGPFDRVGNETQRKFTSVYT